jgi:hypothetical protein
MIQNCNKFNTQRASEQSSDPVPVKPVYSSYGDPFDSGNSFPPPTGLLISTLVAVEFPASSPVPVVTISNVSCEFCSGLKVLARP